MKAEPLRGIVKTAGRRRSNVDRNLRFGPRISDQLQFEEHVQKSGDVLGVGAHNALHTPVSTGDPRLVEPGIFLIITGLVGGANFPE